MSDLHKRNTEAMISTTKRFEALVGELKTENVQQNAKIASLVGMVEKLTREVTMMKVQAQVQATGHGGTV